MQKKVLHYKIMSTAKCMRRHAPLRLAVDNAVDAIAAKIVELAQLKTAFKVLLVSDLIHTIKSKVRRGAMLLAYYTLLAPPLLDENRHSPYPLES